MSDTQEPAGNAVGKVTSVVREEDTAAALNHVTGDKFPAVLSTTRTIALLEVAAGSVLAPFCLAHQLSVGVEVNVKHLAATLPGATVTATARYTGRIGKLYAFEVVAYDAAGEIMRGEHTRAIIDVDRLINSAKKRNPSA
jgi:fluoroacetyl-CoA thioesterase